MENWLVKDYKVRCYNLQNRLKPYKASMLWVETKASKIAKRKKCDELTALKILKKQLEKEVADKFGK